MNKKVSRDSFGSVRKLPSGRWQVRHQNMAGARITAPTTFETKKAALDYLANVRAKQAGGIYRDHRAALATTFGDYAREWIDNGGARGHLAPRTRELYESIVNAQFSPLNGISIARIGAAEVRGWYTATKKTLAVSSAARGGDGSGRLRQSYVLLKSIMATAVRDGLIPENPCTIVGAGVAKSPERPMLEPEALATIVDRMPAHYRLPILVAFAAHLRLGEVIGLRRSDYIADRAALRVAEQEYATGKRSALKQGDSRMTSLPPSVAEQLADHLAATRGFPKDAMFTRSLTPSERGRMLLDGRSLTVVPISRNGLQQAWAKAAKEAGFEGAHFHDVKHSSLTTAARAGASLRELMDRAGHKTSRAALIYQHASVERDVLIAERLGALSDGLFRSDRGTIGARGALHAVASDPVGE